MNRDGFRFRIEDHAVRHAGFTHKVAARLKIRQDKASCCVGRSLRNELAVRLFDAETHARNRIPVRILLIDSQRGLRGILESQRDGFLRRHFKDDRRGGNDVSVRGFDFGYDVTSGIEIRDNRHAVLVARYAESAAPVRKGNFKLCSGKGLLRHGIHLADHKIAQRRVRKFHDGGFA